MAQHFRKSEEKSYVYWFLSLADGRYWMRVLFHFIGSNKADGPDTAVHDAVQSVTTKTYLINVDALLGTRPQCIIRSKLSITDPCANSISLLRRHFDNGIQTGGRHRQ